MFRQRAKSTLLWVKQTVALAQRKKEEKIKKQVKVSWFGLGLSTIQQLYAGKINMTNINISLRAASNAFITLPVFFLQWM